MTRPLAGNRPQSKIYVLDREVTIAAPRKDDLSEMTLEDLQKQLSSLDNQSIMSAKRREVLEEIKLRTAEATQSRERILATPLNAPKTEATPEATKDIRTKRYDVDPMTGIISVNEEDGEYTYKDAVLVSTSIRGPNHDSSRDLVKIDVRPKEFAVDEDGEISHDPENGELTLYQARALAESRRRPLVPDEVITPERVELKMRDLRDELSKLIENTVKETMHGLKDAILPLIPGKQELPFTLNEKGDVILNPKASLSAMEVLVFQQLQKKDSGSGTLIRDGENVFPLPAWMEVKKFNLEQNRKQETHDAIVGVVKQIREGVPKAIAAFRALADNTGAKKAMEGTEWATPPGSPAGAAPSMKALADKVGGKLRSALCPGCGAEILFLEGSQVISCGKCGKMSFFGNAEAMKKVSQELKEAEEQWKAPASKEPPAKSSEP